VLPEGGGGRPSPTSSRPPPDQLAKYADLRKQYFGSVQKEGLSNPDALVELIAVASVQ